MQDNTTPSQTVIKEILSELRTSNTIKREILNTPAILEMFNYNFEASFAKSLSKTTINLPNDRELLKETIIRINKDLQCRQTAEKIGAIVVGGAIWIGIPFLIAPTLRNASFTNEQLLAIGVIAGILAFSFFISVALKLWQQKTLIDKVVNEINSPTVNNENLPPDSNNPYQIQDQYQSLSA